MFIEWWCTNCQLYNWELIPYILECRHCGYKHLRTKQDEIL